MDGPTPTNQEALEAAVALATARRLAVHERCYEDMADLGASTEAVLETISGAVISQIKKSEPDYDVTRPFWILELSIPTDFHTRPLYVKVALRRPTLAAGKVLSFKPSGTK